MKVFFTYIDPEFQLKLEQWGHEVITPGDPIAIGKALVSGEYDLMLVHNRYEGKWYAEKAKERRASNTSEVFCIAQTMDRNLDSDAELIDCADFVVSKSAAVASMKKSLEFVTKHLESRKALKTSEDMVLHASKLAAVGEMASGIAHEVNNPLTVVLGRLTQLSMMLDSEPLPKEKAQALCDNAVNAVIRISKIVNGLRTFSANGDQEPKQMVKVAHLIEDTLSFCGEKLKKRKIELRIKGDINTIEVTCQPVKICQVLLNLLSNSTYAIKDLATKWIEINVWEEKDFVHITVTDSGNGIPRSIRDKLMTPFFTTKNMGEGTGLGLSISRKIVESHQGTLLLDDQSSNTKFVFTLRKCSLS